MQIEVDGVKYIFTTHAESKIKKRGITLLDVKDALTNVKKRRLKTLRDDQESQRTIVTGKNNVLVILAGKNIIVTVYKYVKDYYDCKHKNLFNKKRKNLKKKYGNRLRK